jgi:aminoglycoside phosphotransferase (APT) family kinase protein
MSTIGHPLSDLANLTSPFLFATGPKEVMHFNPAFIPNTTPGLPTKEEILVWYNEVTGWNPAIEIAWADAFQVFRNSAIMQGIAARYALRQASSANAKETGELMYSFGEFGWTCIQTAKEQNASKSKL